MRKNIEVIVAGGLTVKVPSAPVIQKPRPAAPQAPAVEAAPEPVALEETNKKGRK